MNRLARLRRNQRQVRAANGERRAAPGGAIPPWKALSKLDADEAAALAASLGIEVADNADRMTVLSAIHRAR